LTGKKFKKETEKIIKAMETAEALVDDLERLAQDTKSKKMD
jgi:hypothetical protein